VPIVANQIALICALQLIIVEGSLAAHIGGSARGYHQLRTSLAPWRCPATVPQTVSRAAFLYIGRLRRKFTILSHRARAWPGEYCCHGRAVRSRHRRAPRLPRPPDQSRRTGRVQRGITLSDGDVRKNARSHYLQPGFGRLRCSRRRCFVCISCVVDALPEQYLRRRPGTNPLVAAVFRTRELF
jgi:hypothetical protein